MSVADIIAAGVVLVPIAFGGLLISGRIGIGPLASEAQTRSESSKDSVHGPQSVSLEAGETVEYQTDPKRNRWKYHAVFGAFTLPFGWGIPLLIYALRVRKRSRYVVTNRRIIEESPDSVESYDYDEIGQVQTGERALESLLSRGNVQFSVDNRQLITLGWMRNPRELADVIGEHAS